jgi:hypothetical protein
VRFPAADFGGVSPETDAAAFDAVVDFATLGAFAADVAAVLRAVAFFAGDSSGTDFRGAGGFVPVVLLGAEGFAADFATVLAADFAVLAGVVDFAALAAGALVDPAARAAVAVLADEVRVALAGFSAALTAFADAALVAEVLPAVLVFAAAGFAGVDLAAAVLRDALGVCVLTVLVTDAGLVAVARAATVVPAVDLAGTDLDFPARACAGGVAAFGVPFFATPARSAMASPNNKTGARQVAAHSRGWQEYGTYRRPTNTPHDLTRIRAQCVRCSHHLPGQTRNEFANNHLSARMP